MQQMPVKGLLCARYPVSCWGSWAWCLQSRMTREDSRVVWACGGRKVPSLVPFTPSLCWCHEVLPQEGAGPSPAPSLAMEAQPIHQGRTVQAKRWAWNSQTKWAQQIRFQEPEAFTPSLERINTSLLLSVQFREHGRTWLLQWVRLWTRLRVCQKYVGHISCPQGVYRGKKCIFSFIESKKKSLFISSDVQGSLFYL